MKKLHVAPSPLSNRIYCGHVLKDGCSWGANQTDVTGEACAAVAQHALEKGGTTMVTANGKPRWEITVRELSPNAEAHLPLWSAAEKRSGAASCWAKFPQTYASKRSSSFKQCSL